MTCSLFLELNLLTFWSLGLQKWVIKQCLLVKIRSDYISNKIKCKAEDLPPLLCFFLFQLFSSSYIEQQSAGAEIGMSLLLSKFHMSCYSLPIKVKVTLFIQCRKQKMTLFVPIHSHLNVVWRLCTRTILPHLHCHISWLGKIWSIMGSSHIQWTQIKKHHFLC